MAELNRRQMLHGAATAAVGGTAAAALAAAPVAAEALGAAASGVTPHPLAGLTLEALFERYGHDEVMEALGFDRPTSAETEMDRAVALLNAHMAAMNAIYDVMNKPLASGPVEDDLQALVHSHFVQADELVTKLRRMGWGDGSSTSCARRTALLQWHADFDNDASDILTLLQAEEEIEARMRAFANGVPYKGRSVHSWAEDLDAGFQASQANAEVKRGYHRKVYEKFRRREEFGIFADVMDADGQFKG